jgi:hypothetical protein
VHYEHFLLAALLDFSFVSGAFEAAESYQKEIWSLLAFLSMFDLEHA